jgi:hypothetical protein
MKADMLRVFRATPAPFLWIEDDALLTPHYVPTIDVPEECQWVYLAGCSVSCRQGELAARRVFRRERLLPSQGPDLQHLFDTNMGFAYAQFVRHDETWARVATMYSHTAMLVLTDRLRDRLIQLLETRPDVSDHFFALEQSQWLTLVSKKPFFFQADKNCIYTLDYFRETPLRVDFAGGWLDVPQFSRPEGRIVNLAVTPQVMLADLEAGRCSGLGGSAARAVLSGRNALDAELATGAGWQDPAAIAETGLCVWQSGPAPKLLLKTDPDELLRGRMALLWTGERAGGTPASAARPKDFAAIGTAGQLAEQAVRTGSLQLLAQAVKLSYAAQLGEGMPALPDGGEAVLARKYCGSGFGGNALYLFADATARDRFVGANPQARPIEPFLRRISA